MELGDLLIAKNKPDEYGLPVFIWEVVEDERSKQFVINAAEGLTKQDVQDRFAGRNLHLPNHAKFEIMSYSELYPLYRIAESGIMFESHNHLSTVIRESRKLDGGYKVLNAVYSMSYLIYIMAQSKSPDFLRMQSQIEEDKYFSSIPLSGIILDGISKDFAILKTISVAKALTSSNFPSEDESFANSLIQQLSLGMIAGYYQDNKDRIKSATINYEKNFKGDYVKFSQFKYLLNKVQEEINWYNTVKEEEDKILREAEAKGFPLPEEIVEKGAIMKLLEFDMAFWQNLFLHDVIERLPVEKPYKEGVSESYKCMLLLPYFVWLAPNLFNSESSRVNPDNYKKLIVEKMKNFVDGKISM